MEKRINKKIDTWRCQFKKDVITQISQHFPNTNCNELLTFINEYPTIIIEPTDLAKRKRVKNSVPFCERCCALRANNEQCTRRKKPGERFCGTHIKGTPHGEIKAGEQVVDTTMKIEVWAQDIKGIIYFIDKSGNVYDPQHIHQNLKNPNIIAKWEKDSQGNYTIPKTSGFENERFKSHNFQPIHWLPINYRKKS